MLGVELNLFVNVESEAVSSRAAVTTNVLRNNFFQETRFLFLDLALFDRACYHDYVTNEELQYRRKKDELVMKIARAYERPFAKPILLILHHNMKYLTSLQFQT